MYKRPGRKKGKNKMEEKGKERGGTGGGDDGTGNTHTNESYPGIRRGVLQEFRTRTVLQMHQTERKICSSEAHRKNYVRLKRGLIIILPLNAVWGLKRHTGLLEPEEHN